MGLTLLHGTITKWIFLVFFPIFISFDYGIELYNVELRLVEWKPFANCDCILQNTFCGCNRDGFIGSWMPLLSLFPKFRQRMCAFWDECGLEYISPLLNFFFLSNSFLPLSIKKFSSIPKADLKNFPLTAESSLYYYFKVITCCGLYSFQVCTWYIHLDELDEVK